MTSRRSRVLNFSHLPLTRSEMRDGLTPRISEAFASSLPAKGALRNPLPYLYMCPQAGEPPYHERQVT